MLRSVCLFVLLAQSINLMIAAPSTLSAQNVTPSQPNRVRISDSSPLNTLKSRPGSVSPASFLKNNRGSIPAGPAADPQDKIPSILSGKKTIKRVVREEKKAPKNNNEIDPLNIPSSPITPKKTVPLSTNSSFQPSSSGFAPPKSTQFQSTQPINSNKLQKPSEAKSAIPQPPNASNFNANRTAIGNNNRIAKPSSSAVPSVNPPSGPLVQERPTGSGATGSIPPRSVSPRSTTPRSTTPRSTTPRSTTPRSTTPRSTTPGTSAPVNPPTRINPNLLKQQSAYRDNVPQVAERSPGVGSSPVPRTDNRIPTAATRTEPSTFSTQNMSPQLQLTTSGPRSITVNKAGEFVVKIKNIGQVDATDVVVGIEIPKWVEVVAKPQSTGGDATVKDLGDGKAILWQLNYLPRTRDAMISLKLEPGENRPFNLKTEWTTAPVSGEAKVMVTQAKLATRISGPAEVKYGQKAVYKITIENTGNGDAEKVQVALSRSLGGDSASVGVIEAGATKQFEVELTAGQAGVMKLEADVKGDAGIKSAISKEIIVRRAKLVVKATGPKFKYAGSALTYNISVENQGDAAARNINAAALLPLNAEYISGLSQVAENEGRKIGWKIPEIPAGSKRDFIVTCLINRAGDARMEIGVRSEDGLTSGGIVNTKVEALADLKLEVVDPRGPQAVGRQVTYELHIKNRGTKAARNVQISGEFSDFIDPVSGVGAKASIEKGGVIVFEPIPEIKVGQSVVVKVVAKASQAGTHTFRAIVQCKGQDIRKVSEGTTKFFGDGAPTNGSANSSSKSAPAESNTTGSDSNVKAKSPSELPVLPPTSGFQPNK